MMSFWKRFREFLVPIGMAGLFVALFYFGILRVSERNFEKMNAIQQATVDRKIFEEQEKKIPEMERTAELIRAADDRMNVLLSGDQDVISLVELVETLGSDLGVSVVSEALPAESMAPSMKKASKKAPKVSTSGEENISSEEEKPSIKQKKEEKEEKEELSPLLPSDRSVYVLFKVMGSYQQVLEFFQKMDTMPTLLDVLSFEISTDIPESEEGIGMRNGTSVGVSSLVTESVTEKNPFATGASSAYPSEIPTKDSRRILALLYTAIYMNPR